MQNLYDAIGGLPALEAAVQRFSERVARDPEVASFFARMDLHQLKRRLSAFLGQAVGGPVRYKGSTMRRAHGHLRIEQRHFDAIARHLAGALRDLAVPDVLIAAVMERVWPLATQIVNTRSRTAAAA